MMEDNTWMAPLLGGGVSGASLGLGEYCLRKTARRLGSVLGIVDNTFKHYLQVYFLRVKGRCSNRLFCKGEIVILLLMLLAVSKAVDHVVCPSTGTHPNRDAVK
jgi:hypothetical protein